MSGYFFCPHCGAVVPTGASACPECGSDEETGWSEDAAYGELFAYYDEPETNAPAAKLWARYLVPALVVLTLLAFLAYWLPWSIYLVPVVLLVAGIAYYATQVLPNTRRSVAPLGNNSGKPRPTSSDEANSSNSAPTRRWSRFMASSRAAR